MANEKREPVKEVPVSEQGIGMRKYAIYRFQKKTTKNPTGKTLLTVTFAPSIESACEIGEEMMKQLEGPRFEVVAM